MPRITWPDLPDAVRTRVEGVLGDEVVAHRSHPGGFSPGTADRVQTAAGRVAFVKAVHPDLNPDTPDLHRAELRVMRALPPSLPTPRLIDGFELDGWVVLVLQHVDGAHPTLPWTPESFEPVLDATLRLSDGLTPTPLPGLVGASAMVADHVGVDTELIVDVLVSLTGFMVERCRRPDPSGLPTLRAFQRTLAEGMTSWLRATALS